MKGNKQYNYEQKNSFETLWIWFKHNIGLCLTDHMRFQPETEDDWFSSKTLKSSKKGLKSLNVAIQIKEEILNIVGVYAPDISEPKEGAEPIYENLQNEVNKISKQNKLLRLGDLKERIENIRISSIVSRYNEDHININGEMYM